MYKYIQLQFSLKKGLSIAEQNIQQFIFGKNTKMHLLCRGLNKGLLGGSLVSCHIDIKNIGTEFTFNTEVCLNVPQAWPL